MKQESPQIVWLSVHPTHYRTVIKVRKELRVGEVVGEGRVEEGGGMRGS